MRRLLILLLLTPHLFAAADREAAVPQVLIPIAGDVPGANGTHFQTEVTISNRGTSTVRAAIFWLPQNQSGSLTTPVRTLTLDPQTTLYFPRFVTEILGQAGLGAFVVRALNDDGSTNQNARLDVYARVWTPAGTGPGTYSQGIYGATLTGPGTDDLQPIPAWVYGLRQDADFRTNYGIVNLADAPRTFTITVSGETGQRFERTVTLPAASMIHEPLPPGQVFGALTIGMVIHQLPSAQVSLPWTGFASSVDNHTGDAWYSKAQGSYRNNQP